MSGGGSGMSAVMHGYPEVGDMGPCLQGHSSSCPVSLIIISLRESGMVGLVGPVVDNSYSHGDLGGFLAQP